MDVATIVDALSADERQELLELLTDAERPEAAGDEAGDDFWCCGGGLRSRARRRALMDEMRQMCCGMR